ncbi:MAG: type II toxin-antitoxin system Phd/YefM family antitoxin [Acidobacteriota bacterium]
MKQAKITELRDRLSYYLRRVRRGETIEVVDRNVPIARLVPVQPILKDEDSWIERLRRSGLVRSGPLQGVKSILQKKPAAGKSTGVLEALLEERRRGR